VLPTCTTYAQWTPPVATHTTNEKRDKYLGICKIRKTNYGLRAATVVAANLISALANALPTKSKAADCCFCGFGRQHKRDMASDTDTDRYCYGWGYNNLVLFIDHLIFFLLVVRRR